MKGMLAKKLMMSQAIDKSGKVQAITVLQALPNVITQIKREDRDGYFALQLGLLSLKSRGTPIWKIKRELRFPAGDYRVGDTIKVDIFTPGDTVKVSGITKGKGFAGTIKRHGFKSGPGSHGHDHHRQPGSIGAMGMPRVHKGKRMSGRMGGNRVTIKNLKIVAVDTKHNLLAVSGAIPGANQQTVIIQQHESS